MPNSYPAVKKVKATDDYKLILTFSNGEIHLFDMKPYLKKGIFIELLNVSIFNTARVSFDTVEWDNGADFDPEVLYKIGKKIKGEKYSSTNRQSSSAAESSTIYRKR